MSDNPTLTPEAKKALQDYLLRWLVGIGIANLAAAIAVVVYFSAILTSIGERAEKSAIEAAKQRVSENDLIRETMKSSLTSSFNASIEMSRLQGRTQETLDQLHADIDTTSTDSIDVTEKMKIAQKRVMEIEQLLDKLKDDQNVATIEAISGFFSKNPDAAKSLASLNNSIAKMNAALVETSNHAHRTRLELDRETKRTRRIEDQLSKLIKLTIGDSLKVLAPATNAK